MTFIQVGGEEGAFSSVGEDRLKKRVTEREKKFYESLLDKNAVLKDYVPHFYGVESHGDEHYVIMENLLADYAKPCVLDIKMGTTSVPEDATPTEKVIMDRDDQNSTTSSMGIQLIGMQYFDQNEETVRRERPWGKELKEGQMAGALRQFFGPKETRVRVLPVVLHNLCQIRSVIESQQHGVRLYSSSILIAYDGDMGGMSKTPRVRMIDFAHVISMHGGGFVEKDLGFQTAIHWFIVMDLMDGNLSQLIRSAAFASATMERKARLCQQICKGLEHLHSHQIIHRDIKPENILYKGKDWHVRIADLGISKPTTDTLLRTAIGTSDYMAPELSTPTGLAAFGTEVDIFSLGILIWEVFTQEPAYVFRQSARKRRPPFLRLGAVPMADQMPRWLRQVITLCTHLTPQKRPSAKQLVETFEKHIQMAHTSPSTLGDSDLSVLMKKPKANTVPMPASFSPNKQEIPPTLKWYYQTSAATPLPVEQWYEVEGCTAKLNKAFSNGGELSELFPLQLEKSEPPREYLLSPPSLLLLHPPTESHVQLTRRMFGDVTRKVKITARVSSMEGETPMWMVEVTSKNGADGSDAISRVVYATEHDVEGADCSVDAVMQFEMRYLPPYAAQFEGGAWITVRLELYGISPAKHPLVHFQLPLTGTEEDAPLVMGRVPFTKGFDTLPRYLDHPSSWEENPTVEQLEELQAQFLPLAQQSCERMIDSLILHAQQILEKPPTSPSQIYIYDGMSGIAYTFWKYATHPHGGQSQKQALQHASSLLAHAEEFSPKDHSSLSFYTSIAGIHALRSVVAWSLEDEAQTQKSLGQLLDMESLLQPTLFEREILYGVAGFMGALLFVKKHLPPGVYQVHEEKIEALLKRAFLIVFDEESDQIPYTFRRRQYRGAAHGLAGILMSLLYYPSMSKQEKYSQKIKNGLAILSQCEQPLLHHWCHGPPGELMTFCQAYRVYHEEAYRDGALQLADKVWKNGLLRKGFNLCHGVVGNAYAFLRCYQCTQDPKWLYRALCFASSREDKRIRTLVFSHFDHQRKVVGLPDHPNSLMEGMAGEVCLLLDLHTPLQAAFPGYDSDWFYSESKNGDECVIS